MISFMKWIGPLMNLLLTFFKYLPCQKAPHYGKWLINVIAFLLLLCGSILGCMALYAYLVPYWGEALSLLVLCLLFLGTSGALYMLGRRLKPQPAPSHMMPPLFEKIFSQLPHQETLSHMLPDVSPKMLVALCAAVVAVSCLLGSKQKK
jgi:hypothetical protein